MQNLRVFCYNYNSFKYFIDKNKNNIKIYFKLTKLIKFSFY